MSIFFSLGLSICIGMTNGYPSIGRAASLRRVGLHQRLAHLVPLLHRLGAAPADVRIGPLCERLFGGLGLARGDFEEGWWQGMSLSSLVFCIAIQPEVEALDAELVPYGGAARFIMDDGLVIGPPEVVFAAIERFAQRILDSLGLVMKPSAYACYSMEYDLAVCPFRGDIPIGVIEGWVAQHDHGQHYGIVVGGVPIGGPVFMDDFVGTREREVVSRIEQIVTRLHSRPYDAWALIRSHCAHLFTYDCRHIPPIYTVDTGRAIDLALRQAFERLVQSDMRDSRAPRIDFSYLDDGSTDLLTRRFHLPASMRGGGIRSVELLCSAGYAACYVEEAERFCDRHLVAGGPVVRGRWPSLVHAFGAGSFSSGGHRLQTFIHSRTVGFLRDQFVRAWGVVRNMVRHAPAVTGPLSWHATLAGAMRGEERLQRAITRQVEQVQRDALHADFDALPRGDVRRLAWFSVGVGSSQWITPQL